MKEKKVIDREYVIYEECPICNKDLESILDKDNYVIDYWCNNCGRSFELEDLEIEEIKLQEKIDKWLKN